MLKTERILFAVEPELKTALMEFAAREPEYGYSAVIRRAVKKEIGFKGVDQEKDKTDL